jgi:HEAT repeat protein
LIRASRDRDPDVEIRATDGLVNFYIPGYVARDGLTGSMSRGVRQMKGFFSSRNDQVLDAEKEIQPDVAAALADVITHGTGIDARANAARAAGILRDHAAVPALAQALHAKNDELIFESLVALQKIRDPSAGPDVSFLAHDLDDRIQSTALETIAVLRSTSSAPDVRAAVHSARNIRTRRAAMKALAVLATAEDRPVFLQYVNDRDAELRSAALEGIGRIREPEDFPTLQKSFDEGEIDWRIHLAAAFGMVNEGKVDSTEFSPLSFLVEALGTRGRSDAAASYLGELVARDGVPSALIKLIPEMNKDQKIALCPVLAQANSPDALAALHGLAKDIDPDIAFAASKALKTTKARQQS